MNILAFDTCLGAVSAAVRWRSPGGEWLLREQFELCSTGHAERLFPMIAEVMEEAGMQFPAIDRIAVTTGPGTFTGVRSGIAAARAFALATGKPVVGMTSLSVMALRAESLFAARRGGRPLAVAVDARRGMFYFQRFSGDLDEAGPPQLLTPEQAAPALGTVPVLIVGSGAAMIADLAGPHAEACLPDLQPHARMLALVAPVLAPPARVAPTYLREPDAKLPATSTVVQP
jgi:tRNA threonylcarbamoyl adenosine modification protein YeaZ